MIGSKELNKIKTVILDGFQSQVDELLESYTQSGGTLEDLQTILDPEYTAPEVGGDGRSIPMPSMTPAASRSIAEMSGGISVADMVLAHPGVLTGLVSQHPGWRVMELVVERRESATASPEGEGQAIVESIHNYREAEDTNVNSERREKETIPGEEKDGTSKEEGDETRGYDHREQTVDSSRGDETAFGGSSELSVSAERVDRGDAGDVAHDGVGLLEDKEERGVRVSSDRSRLEQLLQVLGEHRG
jgi:hypothetical protein